MKSAHQYQIVGLMGLTVLLLEGIHDANSCSWSNAFHLAESNASDTQKHCEDDPDKVRQVDVLVRNVCGWM